MAWFRTGLTLVALGIAAGQFLAVGAGERLSLVRTLSTAVVLTGTLMVAVGSMRYRTNRLLIERADFSSAGRSIAVATAAALVTAALAITFVWLLPGS